MKSVKLSLVGLLILTIASAALSAQAQDGEPEPPYLIQMLSMTPADAATVPPPSYLQIQYADLRANEQARPGVPMPASLAAFSELDDGARDLWGANVQRLVGLAPDFRLPSAFDAEMVNYLGFDYFEIDRTLYFGPPPDQGTIYGGHFDTDQIAQTLTGRTYTITELNGIQVLCGPVGCENGGDPGNWLPDVGERDPETLRRKGVYPILGGELARQEPIALLPGYMLVTPEWGIMGNMTAAAAGTGASLYDLPEYRTIADFAVTGGNPDTEGSLIQVIFFQPSFFDAGFADGLAEMTGQSPGELLAQLDEWGIDVTGKPLEADILLPYKLGAIVDRQEGSEQVHSIVLVYPTENAAQDAAAEVTRRIPLQSAYWIWQEDMSLLDKAAPGYTLEPPQAVYNAGADRWLAVATVRVPMPGNEPDPEQDNVIPRSGRLICAWYQSMMMNMFMPVQLP